MGGTMQGTTQYYTLDMAAAAATKAIEIKEGDTNSRFAQFSLVAFREPWIIPFGSTIHINVKKTDGTVATATCTRVDDHTVLAPITEQMGTVPGTHLGELYFVFPAGDIKSQSFKVLVHPAAVEEARIESSDDFQSLQDSLRDVKESTETADIAAQYATEQGNQARDAAQRAEDAADSIQAAVDAAAAAKVSEANAKTSETAAAQTKQEVTDYVEAQKAAFVGYSKRESDSKYANALTATTTGEGGVTVEDAWTAPVLGLDVAGKSEQVVTTGAQLQPFGYDTITHVGVTLTIKNDLVSLLGTATYSGGRNTLKLPDVTLQAGSYTISVSDAINAVMAVTDDANSVLVQGAGIKELKFNIVKETSIHIGFNVISGNVYNIIGLRIMLNAGDTALPWEPYTGCAPSPSPDYPQDIISVGTVSTGKQMLNPALYSKGVYNGVAFTNDSQGRIILNGTATAVTPFFLGDYINEFKDGETYCLSNVSNSNFAIIENGSTKYSKVVLVNKSTMTQIKAYIQIGSGIVCTNKMYAPMLNAGENPLPWEPYTGGKPSPSVEYPQVIEVTATGANLFDASTIKSTALNGVTFIDNGDGSITVKGTATAQTSTNFVTVNLEPGQYRISGGNAEIKIIARVQDGETINYYSNNKFEVTISSNINIYMQIDSGKTVNSTVWPMLNVGDMALSWEQYKGRQNVPITLTEPLRGIGDYRDRIMCRDGEWGIERWLNRVDYDGSEDEVWSIQSVNDKGITNYTISLKTIAKKNIKEALCTCLQYDSSWIADATRNGIILDSGSSLYIRLKEVKTLDDFRKWLIENPLIVIYPLATPTWEPLPAATQQALNALTTYADTTHLTITAGGPPAEVTLEYVQDTQKAIEQHDAANRQYTDNQIAAIVAALPTATQAAIVDNQTTKLLQEV